MTSIRLTVRRTMLLLPSLVAGLTLSLAPIRAAEPVSTTAVLPGLDRVPRDAAAFVHVRVADVATSPLLVDVRHLVDRAGAEAWKTFEKKCPVPPTAIDSLSVVMLTPQTFGSPFPSVDPEAVSALLLVTTKTPYDRLRIMQALGHREKTYRRNWYYFNEELWSGLVLLDDRTFAIGSEDAVCQYLDRLRSPSGGPLQAALEQGARNAHVLVGLNARLLANDQPFKSLPPPLRPLLECQCGTVALQLDKELQLNVSLHYPQEAQARTGEQSLRAALNLMLLALATPIQELEKQLAGSGDGGAVTEVPEKFFYLVGLGMLREIESLLKSAPIERTGAVVQLPLKYRASDPAKLMLVSPMGIFALGTNATRTFNEVAMQIGQQAGKAEKKSPEEEHLRQLAAALDRYHEAKGAYPPAAICDAAGRPLLSWRVALLPYVGEEALYREFRLDEPWDSLHNKRLLKRIPKTFQQPNSPNAFWVRTKGKTRDLVFTGPNTLFDGKQGTKKSQVPAKAALVVLADGERAVYWSKPGELAFEAGKPLPSLFAPASRFGFSQNRPVHAILGDGTFRTIARTIDEKDLRELIQRDPAAKSAPAAASPEHLDTIWNALTQGDEAGAARAFAGIAALIRSPEKTVPFLRERLRPIAAMDAAQAEKHIAALDSNAFATREQAAQSLEKLGVLVLPALHKRLAAGKLSLETQKRLERLVQKLEAQPVDAEELRAVRAIEVLRAIGTPEVQGVLGALAQGADAAAQTTAANTALKSLRERAGGK